MKLHTHSSKHSTAHTAGQIPVKDDPLVILHGLFGSWDNWASQMRRLEQHFPVIGIDLRNHGKSPHLEAMTYSAMAEDVRQTLGAMNIDRYHLLGHSMGGKVAMELASRLASDEAGSHQTLSRLILVDIAPRLYKPHHDEIIAALNALDVSSLADRREADDRLKASIPDVAVRLFLLKNLTRDKDRRFQWSINLPAITRNYPELLQAPTYSDKFTGPVLIICGGSSDYVQPTDDTLFDQWFTDWTLETIPGAGHWPHASHAERVYDLLKEFVQEP